MDEATHQKFLDLLQRLRGRIEQYRQRHESIGEQNTKAMLIDPMLSALGWDPQDFDEVRREYRRMPQDNPVDYALLMHRSPVLFVEAKALEGDLNNRRWISQVLGYATVVGVEWCVLTNGDEYRLYNSHAPVDVEEKLYRTIRISNAGQDDFIIETLQLLSKENMGDNLLSILWKAHFVDCKVKSTIELLVKSENPALIDILCNHLTPKLTPDDICESLKRADIRVDFPKVIIPWPQTITPSPTPPVASGTENASADASRVKLSDLIHAGFLKPPVELERNYKGQHLTALVQIDGTICFEGISYNSPSIAGAMAKVKVLGPPTNGRPLHNTNGWDFWYYPDPETGKLEILNRLRQKYQDRDKDQSISVALASDTQ